MERDRAGELSRLELPGLWMRIDDQDGDVRDAMSICARR